MQLIFEKSRDGRRCCVLPPCDVEGFALPSGLGREKALNLPQMAEVDISRHYTSLAERTYGINNGFYPLGSCTMKYNPKIGDELAALPGFTAVHPLQPVHTVQGCLEALVLAEGYLCEITGMDAMTFQPAAGAHGELLGLFLIKQYHKSRGDAGRVKIIVPDSAHGTNPASAAMAGFSVVSVPSTSEGHVDLGKLREAADDATAGIMLTNPDTAGVFDPNILEITEIVHDAGGLAYYDGANLNAVMGVVRPGDMGFDVVHLNLHKTFSTPHGGGGPGSGPVGCKRLLAPFMPHFYPVRDGDGFTMDNPAQSVGTVKAFYGNFLVVVRALAYLMTLGAGGICEVSETAVLNANYMKGLLAGTYDIAYGGLCMHEFVISLERLKKEHGVSAMDVAKALLDKGIHPPTMYFPLGIPEALMVEPAETESKETIDEAAGIFLEIYRLALENPGALRDAPVSTPVRRPDEVGAARNPRLRYLFG